MMTLNKAIKRVKWVSGLFQRLLAFLTFIPSHLDTALNGRKALNVLRALKAPMLAVSSPSAAKLIKEI